MKDTPMLQFRGIHAYDGHIHDESLDVRRERCDAAFEPVHQFRCRLQGEGLIVKELVAGGSPTFAVHAKHADRTLSPGTTVLWDFGYGDKHPADLPFLPAAVLLARVISKPGRNRLTLDLGHKSVAPENPHPRVRFEELPDAVAVMQSEEHLVLETERAHEFTHRPGPPRSSHAMSAPPSPCMARPRPCHRKGGRFTDETAGRSRHGTETDHGPWHARRSRLVRPSPTRAEVPRTTATGVSGTP
jgi:hypothetical protein